MASCNLLALRCGSAQQLRSFCLTHASGKLTLRFSLLCSISLTGLIVSAACCHKVLDGPGRPIIDSSLTKIQSEDPASADAWPTWRGINASGVSFAKDVAVQWTTTDGVRWQTAVPGAGTSSPVVWGEHVLLTSAVGDATTAQHVVWCFRRRTGELAWKAEAGVSERPSYDRSSDASASVATDGRLVFAYFRPLGLFCYDLAGGQQWHVPLQNSDQNLSLASNPVLYADTVVQVFDHQGHSYIAAFEKASGRERWRVLRDSLNAGSTPVFVESESGGVRRSELIVTAPQHAGKGMVVAYDPQHGHELWRAEGNTDTICPTVIAADGLVVSTSGRNGPIVAHRAGGAGDVSHSRLVWRHVRGGPYMPSGVAYKDRLYLVSDSGWASCYRLSDGEEVWRERLKGPFSASLVAASGRLYAVNEHGTVFVFKAADVFQLEATNAMDEPTFASPAIAAGQLFLRTQSKLFCLEGTPKAPALLSGESLSPGDKVHPVELGDRPAPDAPAKIAVEG